MGSPARTVVPLRGETEAATARDEDRMRRLERELAATRAELRDAKRVAEGIEAEFLTANGALRRVNEELRLVFDHVPVAIVLCAADGSVVSANVTAHEWLGVPDSALLGRPYYRHVPASCRERVRAADEKVMALGDEATSDVHRLDVPGLAPRWVRTARVPFHHRDTGEPMLLLMSEDCTDRHEEEQRAEFFRSRMELALRASNVGTWDHLCRTGETFWSDRFKAIMGLPPSFSPAEGDFLARVHPGDVERVRRIEAEHASSERPYTFRARILRPDGEVRWVARSGRMYELDGVAERFAGTVVDETELVTRLERSNAMNQQMRLAERLSRTGYWSFRLDGRERLYWSDEVWSIHGLERGEGVASVDQALALYHPEDAGRVAEAFAETVEFGRKLEFRARVVRPDGEIRHVAVLGVKQGGSGVGDAATLFGVIADVTAMTERERTLKCAHDELARSNEELSRFGYVCSHDMKEPVRMIQSMSALLLSAGPEQDPLQTRQILERINANTVRLRAIIDSLLAYSRVDARIETGPVALDRVAAEVRESLAVAIAEKRAALEVEPLPTVHGARVHFVQLLQNLVGNALAYAVGEAPRVRIRSEREGAAAVLIVEDDGPGIPEAERDRVFAVFTRLELDASVEGTGLGLSICQRIVQQYGGTIECVDSALGGAAFRIVLPDVAGGDG